MGTVAVAFYQAVLRARDVEAPVDRENLRALIAWQRAEGGHALNNPFDTIQPMPGDSWYNSFGPHGEWHVRNYPDPATGITATVATLTNGRYRPILAALRAGASGRAVCAAVDASPWGTHGAEREYLMLYSAGGLIRRRVLRVTVPLTVGSDVRMAQEALIRHGYQVGPTGADGRYGTRTEAAVRAFQDAHHLAVDGVIGVNTWHALGVG